MHAHAWDLRRPASVVSGPPPGSEEGKEAWDAEAAPTEPICQQKQHLKVLDKGVPEDAMPSIKGKQVPMPAEITAIPGLMNSQGVKASLCSPHALTPALAPAKHPSALLPALLC